MLQFTVPQHVFKRALSQVSHAVPTRTDRSIERYIRASVEGHRIRLSAGGEDIGIHCWMDVQHIEGEGVVLLPASLIAEFVSHMPAGSPISVISPSPTSANACQVRCLRSSADLLNGSDDPAEFPAFPTFAEGGDLLMRLDTDLLKEIISQIVFAAAEKADPSNPWSIGMLIEVGEKKATFCATDTFRLACKTIALPSTLPSQRVIVPAPTMEKLAGLLPGEGVVQVLLTPRAHLLLFHIEAADRAASLDLSARLLHGSYPQVQRAIPQMCTTRAVLSSRTLEIMVRALLPFARQAPNYKIHLSCRGAGQREDANTVRLEVRAPEVGDSSHVLGAHIEGADQSIDLRASYLSDILTTLRAQQMTLELTAANRPAIIKATGYVYVLSPVVERPASVPAAPTGQAPAVLTNRA